MSDGRLKIIRIKENPAKVRVRRRRTRPSSKQRTRIKTRRQAPARGYVVELIKWVRRPHAPGIERGELIGFAWWDGLKFTNKRERAERFSTTARALSVASKQMRKAKGDWYGARVVPA